jgi:hypothetical protein
MQRLTYFLLSLFVIPDCLAQNIGIGIVNPTDKLHISAATGEDALRVQINAVTKFRVNSNGGVSIGAGTIVPPANGLLVQGSIKPSDGIEASNKLIIESTGDSMILNAGGSQIIIAANGNITIKAPAAHITIDAAGALNLEGASVNIDAATSLNLSGTMVNINGQIINHSATSQYNVSSQMITQTGISQLNLHSAFIRMNNGGRGIARISDVTSGGSTTQTIATASTKVFID